MLLMHLYIYLVCVTLLSFSLLLGAGGGRLRNVIVTLSEIFI